MRSEVVIGLACLIFRIYLLGVGIITDEVVKGAIASVWLLIMGVFLLYEGLPLELSERRYSASYRRWKRLQEELKEQDKKKREVMR